MVPRRVQEKICNEKRVRSQRKLSLSHLLHALYQYELIYSRFYSFGSQLHIVYSVFQSMDDNFTFLFVQRLVFDPIFGESVSYLNLIHLKNSNCQSYPGFKYSILLYLHVKHICGRSLYSMFKIIQYFIITTTARNCIIIQRSRNFFRGYYPDTARNYTFWPFKLVTFFNFGAYITSCGISVNSGKLFVIQVKG